MTDNDMTDMTAAMIAATDRRIAEIRATPPPVMPTAPIRHPAPRSRRNSVPHRSIR